MVESMHHAVGTRLGLSAGWDGFTRPNCSHSWNFIKGGGLLLFKLYKKLLQPFHHGQSGMANIIINIPSTGIKDADNDKSAAGNPVYFLHNDPPSKNIFAYKSAIRRGDKFKVRFKVAINGYKPSSKKLTKTLKINK